MSELHIFLFIFTLSMSARWAILRKWNLRRWAIAVFFITAICYGSYFALSGLFPTPESVIRAAGMGLTGACFF